MNTPPTIPPLPGAPGEDPKAPLQGAGGSNLLVAGLLRNPAALMAEGGQRAPLGMLTLLTLGGALLYGLVIGSFARGAQLWMAPVKFLSGLVLATLICTPSLYVFSVMAGAEFRPRQLGVVLAGLVSLTTLLLVSFAPVAWIFSESSSSVGFVGFLHWVLWLISLGFGLRLARACVRAVGAKDPGTFVVWSGIYLLVTFQMATALRPWLAEPSTFLDPEKLSFLTHWGRVLSR